MIEEFIPIARTLLALKDLKIITFGPRPFDFLACNAPIAPLFKLGVNIQENSELDLLAAYKAHAGDPRIPAKVKEKMCIRDRVRAGEHEKHEQDQRTERVGCQAVFLLRKARRAGTPPPGTVCSKQYYSIFPEKSLIES